jgi:hypothetical protein
MVLTLQLYVLYRSHNKQRLVLYMTLTKWFRITAVDSIYYVVCTESLNKADMFCL